VDEDAPGYENLDDTDIVDLVLKAGVDGG